MNRTTLQRGLAGGSFFLIALGFLLLPAWAIPLRAQAPPEVEDHDNSPYHVALLNYKSGKLDEALSAISDAEKAKPGDVPVEMLKARILTELHQFNDAEKVLKDLEGNAGLTPSYEDARTLTLGDLYLRWHHFDKAAKYYGILLAAKPNDPDLMLKMVYASVGISDFVTAGKLASQLKPLDADHPDYYFAKAALAQAAGKSEDAEADIQTVRTIYGITISNHYFKTYLQVFSAAERDSSPAVRAEPPATNAPAATPHP